MNKISIKASSFEEAAIKAKREIKADSERFLNDIIEAFTDMIQEKLKVQPVRTRTDEEGFYVFLAHKFLAFNKDHELRDRFMNHLCEEIGFLVKDKILETMDKVSKKAIENADIPKKVNGKRVEYVEAVFKDDIIDDIYHELECKEEYNRGYSNCLDDILDSMNEVEEYLEGNGMTS